MKILNRIVEHAGTERKAAVSAINAIQERMGVHVEVAALIQARALGVEVSDLIDPVRESVLKRSA